VGGIRIVAKGSQKFLRHYLKPLLKGNEEILKGKMWEKGVVIP